MDMYEPKQICPLMSYRDSPKSHVHYCAYEHCALWDEEMKMCSIKAALWELEALHDSLRHGMNLEDC